MPILTLHSTSGSAVRLTRVAVSNVAPAAPATSLDRSKIYLNGAWVSKTPKLGTLVGRMRFYVNGAWSNPTAARVTPFTNEKIFVDPNMQPYQAYVDETDPYTKSMLKRIADYGMPVWLGEWYENPFTDGTPTRNAVRAYIDRAKAAASLPLLIVYMIPLRDFNSYSAGGATSATEYRARIDAVAAGIGSDKTIVVLEPDALPFMDMLSADGQSERYGLLQYAIDKFLALGNCSVYLDAGHPDWVPADQMAGRLVGAHVEKCRGFSLNVSNFKYTSAVLDYGKAVSANALNKPFVIDTSRNGLGPPPPEVTGEASYINPDGRALGDRPLTSTITDPLLDANLWLKVVGESDGSRNGAPAAGQFYKSYAVGLAERAPWAQ